MNASMRFFAALLLTAACVTVAVLRPAWLRAVGVELATFDRGQNSTVLAEPPPEVAARASRIAAKTRVVTQLVAGELDLFEAAAHFRHLNQAPPESNLLTSQVPGETDAEKQCRQVIRWVEAHGRHHMPRRDIDQLVAELEEILAARLYEDGRFELPDLR